MYTSYIQDWQLCNDNQVEVVTLALKKFDILNKIRFQGKPTSAGRKIKITTQSTRQLRIIGTNIPCLLLLHQDWPSNSFQEKTNAIQFRF